MPRMSLALSRKSCFDSPFSLQYLSRSRTCSVVSSPSPKNTISKKSAIGSGLHAHGPPQQIIGVSSVLSFEKSLIPARSSILSTLV